MLIFDKSVCGRRAVTLPALDVPEYNLDENFLRNAELNLPEVAEIDLVRHYIGLSLKAKGVDNVFYPLGSCTMKYNPKLNEVLARNPAFTSVHPLQPASTVQGSLEVMYDAAKSLAEITGMDEISLEPAAGAHGTNPASAAMCGFEIINVKSDKRGNVDLKALKEAVGEDTAALMLTNPNTLGLLDEHILKITSIVHKAGGLVYYDGANLNAVMGVIRPGDLGFDVVHLNLHKTFSTPHGGGGPGSGAIGCKKKLAKFLPNPTVGVKRGKYFFKDSPDSIGKVKAFYGNFLVVLRAYAYILTLGKEGIREASENAVLNANYLRVLIAPYFKTAFDRTCMHEFVLSLEKFHEETGVSAMDVAKALIDKGIHPPTMYFPLIVHEALMFEPTETESRETLEAAADMMREIFEEAKENADSVKASPVSTPISRPDEVLAARKPCVKRR